MGGGKRCTHGIRLAVVYGGSVVHVAYGVIGAAVFSLRGVDAQGLVCEVHVWSVARIVEFFGARPAVPAPVLESDCIWVRY
jgi:hypothetical protein